MMELIIIVPCCAAWRRLDTPNRAGVGRNGSTPQRALCGGRGCDRACQGRGVHNNKASAPFDSCVCLQASLGMIRWAPSGGAQSSVREGGYYKQRAAVIGASCPRSADLPPVPQCLPCTCVHTPACGIPCSIRTV